MSRWYEVNSSLARRCTACVESKVMRSDPGREERAAEDVRRLAVRFPALKQGTERSAPGVAAGVRSRAGDAAAESERAVSVVEQGLTRCGAAETTRLPSIVVSHERDAGDGGRGFPQVGLHPIVGEPLGFEKEHVGGRAGIRAREHFGELGKARGGARAFVM